jgi:hypothetical protein
MPSVTDHKLTNGVRMQEGDAEILEQIDAARIDGRARNVLYRMKQLRAMHSFMLKKRHDFVQAIKKGIRLMRCMAKFKILAGVFGNASSRWRMLWRLWSNTSKASTSKKRSKKRKISSGQQKSQIGVNLWGLL